MNSPDPGEIFVTLLARHERMLTAYVTTLVTHPQDADDILQDAKVIMWRHFSRFQSGTNFGAWARKIAFHQVLSHRKRKKREGLQLSDSVIEIVAEEFEQMEPQLEKRQKALSRCLNRLPEAQRQILRLRYHEQLSIETLAAQVNRTVTALYALLSRTRNSLRRCVDQTLSQSGHYETEP